MSKDPEIFLSRMKLCQIVILQIFLHVREMLSELFRKDLYRDGLLFIKLILELNKLGDFVKKRSFGVFNKQHVVVEKQLFDLLDGKASVLELFKSEVTETDHEKSVQKSG